MNHRLVRLLALLSVAALLFGGQVQASQSTPVTVSIPPWLTGDPWRFQVQYAGEPDLTVDADLFMLDLFDVEASVFAEIRDRGQTVICYMGTAYEDWRSDVAALPESVLGKPMVDWPGERWLDIRSSEVQALMIDRIDLAETKGCSGVVLDNASSYEQDTGFPLTPEDQLAFNKALAAAAHERDSSPV